MGNGAAVHQLRLRQPAGASGVGVGADFEPTHFRAAAADIEDQSVRHLGVEQGRAAVETERGLLAVGDDLKLDAGLLLDAIGEVAAVARLAAGFRRHRPRARDAALFHFARADLEGVDGALHGRFGQPTVLHQAFAKPHDAGEGIDDTETLRRRARDQQAAVVGPQVDRAVDVGRAWCRPAPPMLGPASLVGCLCHLSPRGGWISGTALLS